MKILLFTKSDKPMVKEVINYLREHFDNIKIYEGIRGEPFPKEAYDDTSDILISYLSPWIIPKEVLNKTKLWNINFHPGSPEYPGIGCFNFAIYNEDAQYGVTAHLMEEKVDTGKIIGVKKFALLPSDSVYSLSLKSYSYMLNLFFEIIDFILLNNDLPPCNEKWARKAYTRKELEELCKINLTMTKNEIQRRINATNYPNMPGAYIELFNYKFEYNIKR